MLKTIHIIGLGYEDIEKAFSDGIDNNESEDYPFGTGTEFDSPVIISSVIMGPLLSPSPSLSILSILFPGVSIKDVAATPTGSPPKAKFPIPSASIDHATS